MGSVRRLIDALLFALTLALGGAVIYTAAIAPNARRAERLERRGFALDREVAATAAEVERLRKEVLALQSDPYTIERTLKRKLAKLRPDLFDGKN